MNEVIKVLMEYNLPREVAEKIDIEARRMHFRERIDAFEETIYFALCARIDPSSCFILSKSLSYNQSTYIACMHSIKYSKKLSDYYTSMSRLAITAIELYGHDGGYNYCMLVQRVMNTEDKCYTCRLPLTAGNIVYNNWHAYEDRRGYHLTCKNSMRPKV